jgi:hypothetical protein
MRSPISKKIIEKIRCFGLLNPGPHEILFLMMLTRLITPINNNSHAMMVKKYRINIPGLLKKYGIKSPPWGFYSVAVLKRTRLVK